MTDGKETYPMIPESNWWDLRKKFKQSPPSNVTISYLSTLLNISDKTAANIKTTLKRTGIINDSGAIEERAYKWRDDEQYKEACNDIIKEIYPKELLELYPISSEGDKEAIARWFANRSKVGTSAAKMMASFFTLLSVGDPTAEAISKPKDKSDKPKIAAKIENKPKLENKEVLNNKIKNNQESVLGVPSININIQVHISAEASSNQIDSIFESMAKHLNIRR